MFCEHINHVLIANHAPTATGFADFHMQDTGQHCIITEVSQYFAVLIKVLNANIMQIFVDSVFVKLEEQAIANEKFREHDFDL